MSRSQPPRQTGRQLNWGGQRTLPPTGAPTQPGQRAPEPQFGNAGGYNYPDQSLPPHFQPEQDRLAYPNSYDQTAGGQYQQADPYLYGGTDASQSYDFNNYGAGQSQPGFGNHQSPHEPHLDNRFDNRPHGGGYYDDGLFQGQQERFNAGPLPTGHEEDDEYYYDDDEPGTGNRVWLLTAALIGSIAVGGGLAYAYKSYIGADGKGAAPIVRADAGPARQAPADSGGRKVGGTDSKLLGRLGGGGAGKLKAAPTAQADANGVRKVKTFVVGGNNAKKSSASSSNADADTAIPGFVIDNQFSGGASESEPKKTAPKPQSNPPAGRPRISVARIITVPPDAPGKASKPAAKPQPKAKAAPKPKPKKKVARLATKPAVSKPRPKPKSKAPAASGTTLGYVAVVSSKGSRIAALRAFADLQQKYASVLSGKIPDVQRSDQSARGLGIVYRSVIGPAGSRQSAYAVCRKLKAAGHKGCWVTSYQRQR